jgi:hypothetical protein
MARACRPCPLSGVQRAGHDFTASAPIKSGTFCKVSSQQPALGRLWEDLEREFPTHAGLPGTVDKLTGGLPMPAGGTSESHSGVGGLLDQPTRRGRWRRAEVRREGRCHDVRFTPKSGHVQCTRRCPLCANSGHHATYSITSLAVASSDDGTVRPSALAVLRLITSSYLFGACTGRSAGFSPFRIRSTYSAA